MNNLNHLHEILEGMKTDAEKFYEKGQNAAGTRLRKSLNDLSCRDQKRNSGRKNKKESRRKISLNFLFFKSGI